jgi:glutathione S-transferase
LNSHVLIGQYDSPFVRRVGIALRLYDIPFDHWPWSVFGDADRIRAYNPLTRVPTLVLPGGEGLTDSTIILDYLDGLVSEDAVLLPRSEPERRRAYAVVALACGLGDKAVSLFYERRLHDVASEVWLDRCRAQIGGALARLEGKLAGRYFGARLGHADIATSVVCRFTREAHPGLIDWSQLPRLSDLSARLEATPVFSEISQDFVPPA